MDKEGVEGSQDIIFIFVSKALSLGLEVSVNSCGGILNCCGAEFFLWWPDVR